MFALNSIEAQQRNVSVNTDDLVDFVNPLVGTDSAFELSNGNTYPAIATPWGMNFWTPQTGEMGNGWCCSYDANKIDSYKRISQVLGLMIMLHSLCFLKRVSLKSMKANVLHGFPTKLKLVNRITIKYI